MATAYTDTVLNYSGMLYSKSNNDTKLLDAVYTRGATTKDGSFGTGRRKVNSVEFVLSSGFDVGAGEQPEISESSSTVAPAATLTTRDQQTNTIQLFQYSADVSYLKQSAVGSMAGLNIANQSSNVTNELDFQVAAKMTKAKKDLNYTLINGKYAKPTGNTVAAQSRGLIEAITTNVVEIPAGGLTAPAFNSAITDALAHGFTFDGGKMELWVNPADFNTINDIFTSEKGFSLPSTRTEGGVAITTIVTNFGELTIDYDVMIPKGTYLLLNMNELAIAELDVPNKGNFFYESLSRVGAAEKGQIYGQAGIDYGAEWHHIVLKPQA